MTVGIGTNNQQDRPSLSPQGVCSLVDFPSLLLDCSCIWWMLCYFPSPKEQASFALTCLESHGYLDKCDPVYIWILYWTKISIISWLLILPSLSSKPPSLRHLLLLTHIYKCLKKNRQIEEKNKNIITLSTNSAFAWFCLLQSFDWAPWIKITSLCTWSFTRVDGCVHLYLCMSESSADSGGLWRPVWNENSILGKEFECNVEYI